MTSSFMMDERNSYEKLSIRDSARYSKKYGSTSNQNNTTNESYIKHQVTKLDTLQGIALKYGVTMEQIRRANRLFASDSLFIREYLLIPSTDFSPPTANSLNSGSLNLTSPTTSMSQTSSQVTSPIYDNDEDGREFLGKIDAAIASTKVHVKKIHKNSEFVNGDFESERRKPAVSRMKQLVNNNGNGDINKLPHTVVVSQGNKIKTSMRRYQQQQDEEIFEL